LVGTASGIFTHPGANYQGQGMSYDFTIDAGFQGRQIVVSFDYQTSVNYDAGDILMYVIDVTNGTVMQLAPYSLPKSDTVASSFVAVFQAPSNSTSYRLCWHCATTTTDSYVVKFDNVVASPTTVTFASPVTDWQSWTPTGSWVANTTYAGQWRRVGDSMQLQVSIAIAGGAPTAATLTVNLPSGYTIDDTKLASTSSSVLGEALANDAGTASYVGAVYRASSTSVSVWTNAGAAAWSNTVPFSWTSTDRTTLNFVVPIAGWGSNVQVGSYDGRTVVARYSRGSTLSIPDATDTVVPFTTKIEDTHGAYSTSTGLFTAPVAGYYSVSAMIDYSTASATGARQLYVYKNGALYTVIGYLPGNATWTPTPTGNAIIPLSAGDTLGIYARQNSGGAQNVGNNGANFNHVDISLVPGRSTLAAGDTVGFSAYKASGTHTSTGNWQDVTTWTSEFDLTGSFNVTTGVFTAPLAGLYQVEGGVAFAANATGNRIVGVSKNGTQYRNGMNLFGNASGLGRVRVSFLTRLAAGDTLKLTAWQSSGGNLAYGEFDANADNFFSANRVGN
jgi:hypothetical protein